MSLMKNIRKMKNIILIVILAVIFIIMAFFVDKIGILFPIVVTIFGIIYFFTIDRLTDLIPVIGRRDTPLVIGAIVGSWLVYIIAPFVVIFTYGFLIILVLLGLIYLLVLLYKKAYRRK